MPPDPLAVDALKLFQRFAADRRVFVTEKAQDEFLRFFGREADVCDLWDAVCAATDVQVHKCEADDRDATRTAIILHLILTGRHAYVKASVKFGAKESVRLLSCKRWGL